MKKILIIKPDNIGDFVIFSGLLEYYARIFKNYKIDLVCEERVVELARNCPYLNKIIPYSHEGNLFIRILNKLLFRRKLQARKYNSFVRLLRKDVYDKLIYPVYSRLMEHENIINLVKTKEKIVFDGNFTNDLAGTRFANNKKYTKVVKSSEEDLNEMERNLEFLRELGFEDEIEEMNSKVWVSKKNIITALELQKKNDLQDKRFIMCSPGATSNVRIWDLEKWIEIIQYMLTNTLHKIVFCGNSNDEIIIDKIKTSISDYNKRIIDLSEKTSLSVLAQLIDNSYLFIGSESGPIHIAAAVKTPNICIMGGGHFGRFYPYGNLKINRIVYKKMDCFGCNWQCRFNRIKCMDQIEPKDVIKEINYLLKKEKL